METNAQTNTNVENPDNTDYKALYEQTLKRAETAEAEASKQKGLKDTYAKENAEYKRKEAAQLPEEERKAKEWQELLDGKANLEAEVAQLKLEKEFVANGFSAEETEKLIKGNFAVKDIADISKTLSENIKVQVEAIEQADEGMNRISEVVQNNSATAEESSATSEELSAQAISMDELVAKFQLRD